MKQDAHAWRAFGALVLLTLLFTLAACKKDEPMTRSDDSNDSAGRNGDEPEQDAASSESELEDPRIGPDGAVQVRVNPEDDCDTVNAAGSTYFLCPALQPNTTALGLCWAAGSTLVTINDADENQTLVDNMVDDTYWIGFNDATDEDDWTWAQGSPGSSYENWDEGQPADADFVYISRETGRWSTSTNDPRPYICEVWQ
jgi:predicted small lipoprotein YifL